MRIVSEQRLYVCRLNKQINAIGGREKPPHCSTEPPSEETFHVAYNMWHHMVGKK